ncbi:helix-turn-helix domain-containing protein [Granulicatella sp. zg-ZJ]|uniref:helix-turn-helix transcriptional regulator n=1 Tax=unclassified Granulicatella TaxID=2630493 RepID=UPI0013C215F5|nr:helix-turn-helix transcriptional regulator [Carnobacteriaceae bacterium zg-ZUI78]NEW63082.1 helix-turn-helix domain-containing protein [Granulicatella sp. zg-ZJ]NEW66192.1 helix-turn-helix domain-containing protein [Granulicatella sp. zg-84]QMI86618.1 helix-turn-helix transcriptional regulator [Carnobacteriaceae bacterium zg-84]
MDNRIKELRKEKRLSQEMLADMVDVTRQTIISLEQGKYIASLPLAYQIAKIFHLTIEDVFIFQEDENV